MNALNHDSHDYQGRGNTKSLGPAKGCDQGRGVIKGRHKGVASRCGLVSTKTLVRR